MGGRAFGRPLARDRDNLRRGKPDGSARAHFSENAVVAAGCREQSNFSATFFFKNALTERLLYCIILVDDT